MEKTYVPLACSRTTSATTIHWIDPEKTVVYLGDCVEAMTVLDVLADGAAKLRRIATRWRRNQLGQLGRFCLHFPDVCPALQTLLIQRADTVAADDAMAQQPLTAESVTRFWSIPTYTGPEMGHQGAFVNYRSLLCPDFLERVHFVDQDFNPLRE
ncbi:hypothetical protein VTI74DRAFT_9407 [Chaetomium olivicolor]